MGVIVADVTLVVELLYAFFHQALACQEPTREASEAFLIISWSRVIDGADPDAVVLVENDVWFGLPDEVEDYVAELMRKR